MHMERNDGAEAEERQAKPHGLRNWLRGIGAQDRDEEKSERPEAPERFSEGPEEPGVPERPSDWMPEGRNDLDALRGRLILHLPPSPAPVPADPFAGEGGEAEPAPEPVLYSSFVLDGTEPDNEWKHFLNGQQRPARAMLLSLDRPPAEAEAADVPAPDASGSEGKKQAREANAVCEIKVSRNGLTACAFIFPPREGGLMDTAEGLRALLEEKGVTYGIDGAMLERLAREKAYLKLAEVAHGLAPVDAENGRIVDHVPRERSISVRLNEDDTVNYKDLNWLHRVAAGDILCEVIQPTDPVPGCSVKGREIEGKSGLKPQVPMGRNTSLNEDGTALVAAEEGQVSFTDGRFEVVKLLSLPGNVDSSVGNLEVIGDVVVNGDILEGFLVKASGNVIVRGMIEGATVIAGGNIQICNGMNGNSHGKLDAKGDVSSKFLENCTIQCDGDVRSDSIVNCNITSSGVVDVTSGRGVIIGGVVMACKAVKARIIGNKSHRNTTIVIGATPSFLQRKDQLSCEVARMAADLEELEKNVDYLDRARIETAESRAMQGKLKLRLSVTRMQYAKKKKELGEMEAQQLDVSQCFVEAGEVYPLTQITIGWDSLVVSTITPGCRVHCDGNGITLGLK